MPDVTEQPPQPTDRRGRRVYVWWAVALTLLALLGGSCWFLLRPWLEVQDVLRHAEPEIARARRVALGSWYEAFEPGADKGSSTATELFKSACGQGAARLGGRGSAVWKTGVYLRLPSRWANQKCDAVILAGCCGPQAVPHIRPLLRADDPMMRWNAVWALRMTGSAAAIDLIVDRLADPDGAVRTAAIRALGDLRDERAVPALRATASRDQDAGVRSAAQAALDRFLPGHDEREEALREMVRSLGNRQVGLPDAVSPAGPPGKESSGSTGNGATDGR